MNELDRKDWFTEFETKAEMNSFAIGVIKEIMGDISTTSEAKVIDIARTLEGLEQVWNVKKPLLQTGAEKEIIHPDCTIDPSRIEPFLDRRMAEDILRREG